MLQTVSTANYSRAGMAAVLSALPREEQLWTLGFLYKMMAPYAKEDASLTVDYSTMPGQFTDEEKRLRILESYNSKGGASIDEVEEMLLAI